MHLLYLTDGFPFPLTTGLLRHYFLIRELSQRHRVTLFSWVAPSFRREHAEALAPFTARVETFPERRGRGQAVLRSLRRRLPGSGGGGALGDAVRSLQSEDPFDAVVTVKRCARALDGIGKPVPVVADICDAASMRIRRSMAYSPLHRRAALAAAYLHMRLLERATIRRADHCLFISPRDREPLVGSRTQRTSIVPNGVDTVFWKRTSPGLGHRDIVLTGAMDYYPNVDAALRLISRIIGPVRRQRPGARLVVVGRDPAPSSVEQARGVEGVEVTGFVDDVRPYLDRAAVFCAPLRFGAGAQNKVLEALAMEVPCVVSPLAAEGLRTEEGELPPLEIAGDDRSTVRRLVRCLDQAAARGEPERAGREFVERNFEWKKGAETLERVLEQLTATGGKPEI